MGWQDAVQRTVTGMGYDLVDLERSAGGLLRVTIDRLPGNAYATGPGEFVLVEDCELLTRQLQLLLEVEAVDYARLEVSSPGLDRPLKKPADWQRFCGSEVEITLREAFQGRRKWRGSLLALDGSNANEGLTPATGKATSAAAPRWRLALTADAPPPARPGAARQPRAAGRATKVHADADAAAEAQQVLDFSLDEVREARLVPVVDFKGRRGTGVPTGSDAAQADQADGAQNR